jgi:acyl dehydratase
VSRDAAYGLNYGHDDVRYLNPVYIGDTISGVIEVDDREVRNKTWGLLTLDVLLVNQDSQEVLVENHKMLISRVADV